MCRLMTEHSDSGLFFAFRRSAKVKYSCTPRIMLGIIVTIMVTCDYVVIHILQHTAKICSKGMKLLAQILSVTGKFFCFTDDLMQTAAAAPHEFHAMEQIRNDRIIADGAKCIDAQANSKDSQKIAAQCKALKTLAFLLIHSKT